MGCPITLAGIEIDCKGRGGIREFYAIDYNNISGLTIDSSTQIITGITLAVGKKFLTYKLRSEVGLLESTITSEDAAGTLSYSNTLTANFAKMSASKRLEIMAMAQGDLAVIVKDNNDKYWYLGADFPVTLSEGGASTGTALTDPNQYTVSLSDKGKYLPLEVSSHLISTILS